MKQKTTWKMVGVALLLCINLPAWTQVFTTQYSFTNTPDGANPLRLAAANGLLFGSTTVGGTNGNGTLFIFNTNNSQLATIYNFTGDIGSGNSPNNVVVSGDKIYGTAYLGGTNNLGMVYAVDTNGSGFTSLYSFDGYPDGEYPRAGLVLSNGVIFGTASTGGAGTGGTAGGTIFKINTNGAGYATLHSFTNNPDGAQPQGELVIGGATLYGTTTFGGVNNYGTIFSINTNGTGYTILYSFTNAPGPKYPYGGMVLSDGVLYGTASSGGGNTNGAIYAINTNGSGFKVLYSFSAFAGNTDGTTPEATLMLSGSYLLGTTISGGIGNGGTVFLINTNGTGFSVIGSFTNGGADGSDLQGGVIRAGNAIWGTTLQSGVNNSGTLFQLPMPAITSQPRDITVTNPSPAAFSVTAADDQPVQYQWYFNVTTALANQTNNTLNIASTTTNNAGSYTVVASDSLGSVTSSPAILTVIARPAIAQQPQNYSVTNGYTALFTNIATGAVPLFYQWYFNTNTLIADATNSVLAIPFASTNNAGYYTVVVSNNVGSVTSSPALLTIISTAPIIFTQPQPVTAMNGDPVNFTVVAAGENPLRYQWYTNTVAVAFALVGQTNSTLALAAASNSLAGNYLVVITNTLGKATSSPALLTIHNKPVITLQPQNAVVTNGNPVTFTSAATGDGTLYFQWLFQTNTTLAGATNTSLTFTNATGSLAGFYSVLVTNVFGSVTSSYALLTVSNQLNFLSFSFSRTNGSASFAIANGANSTNWLWASTNLVSTNYWKVIATNVMDSSGLWFFTDSNTARTNNIRFYRFSTP